MHTDHMGVKQYRYEYMYVCPDPKIISHLQNAS